MSKSISRRNFIGIASTSAMGLMLAACGGNTTDTAATGTDAGAAEYTTVEEGKLIVASDLV